MRGQMRRFVIGAARLGGPVARHQLVEMNAILDRTSKGRCVARLRPERTVLGDRIEPLNLVIRGRRSVATSRQG